MNGSPYSPGLILDSCLDRHLLRLLINATFNTELHISWPAVTGLCSDFTSVTLGSVIFINCHINLLKDMLGLK